jgi:glycerol-3-phosphate dehydrogenase
MNDSRMNINTLLTSSIDKFIPGMKGTTLGNYVEFNDFIKNEDGKITGAKVKDSISNKEFNIKSKVVVNCTGIFSDDLRI